MMHTVIFDLDGPILDGRHRHYACYRSILLNHGFKPVELETYWGMKRELRDRRELLAASQALGIYDAFLNGWLDLIEKPEMLLLDRLQPGVPGKLIQWRKEGARCVLATMRRYPDRLQRQLESFRLNFLFDKVVVCDYRQGGVGKATQVQSDLPDLQPEKSLWIGDTEADIEAGRHLGIPVVGVSCGLRTGSFLLSLRPDYLFSDLTEIGRIDALVDPLSWERSAT